MKINVKSPWIIILCIILITTIIFCFPILLGYSKKIKELEKQKDIIDKKIEELRNQEKWIDITEGDDLIRREYYETLLAIDRFNERGIIFRRDYYDENGRKFATAYYDEYGEGKVKAIDYYDKENKIETIVPPLPSFPSITG